MKSQYIIILTIIISLTASMLFLAQIEKNQRIQNQDFWAIYFVDPLTTTNNDFVIDNKTKEKTLFHYKIMINDEIKESQDLEIKKDEQKLINAKDFNNQSITIVVTNEKDKKEIQKK